VPSVARNCVQRGWAREGPIKTQSRIDVPRHQTSLASAPVAVAGVAWAGERGIQRVEVSVDDRAWEQAELADELLLARFGVPPQTPLAPGGRRQAGDHEPDREAVVDRQRLAVHPHRDQGGSPVEHLEREAGGPAVDGTADHLGCSDLDAGAVEHPLEGDTVPAGVPDQVATDLVGDACERDVGLGLGHLKQLGVGQRGGLLDQAGDPDHVGVVVDPWGAEGGVDAEEVVVRGEQWRDPLHVQRRRRRRGWQRICRRRQGDLAGQAARGRSRLQGPAGHREEDGGTGRGAGPHQHIPTRGR
jgi:hypothetical protein